MPGMTCPDDDPADPASGAGSGDGAGDAVPADESAWELDGPVPSAWVAFWPHEDPPTREEVGRAVASWVGRQVEAEAGEPDEDEGML